MLPQFAAGQNKSVFCSSSGVGNSICSIQDSHSFHGLMPRNPERGITWPKVCRLPKSAKLTDLQGDSEQEEGFLHHAASMALPGSWYAGSFLARRTI
jgi:hypothetical protein